jgi:hypothetical protein
MIFVKDSEPKNSLSEMLKTSLPQMVAGIAQQVQQRRQQQNNVFGLQSIGMDPRKAQLASGMDPQTLAAIIKQELLRPSRQDNSKLMMQLAGQQAGNAQGNSPQDSMYQQNTSGEHTSVDGMTKLDIPSEMSDSQLRFAAEQLNQSKNRTLKEKSLKQQRDIATEKLIDRGTARQHQAKETKKKLINDSFAAIEPENKEISNRLETSEADLRDLATIEHATRTGRVVGGPEKKIAEKLGLEDIWTTDATQLIDKVVQGMNTRAISGVKVGGKFTNEILRSIQRQNPSLYNTKTGRLSVIANKKLELNNLKAIDKAKATMIKDYKQRGEMLPSDWRVQAQDKVRPVLDYNGGRMLDNVSNLVYKEYGVSKPMEIYKEFPVSNYKEGKHVAWSGIPHELVKGKWVPVPEWNVGDPNVFGED